MVVGNVSDFNLGVPYTLYTYRNPLLTLFKTFNDAAQASPILNVFLNIPREHYGCFLISKSCKLNTL